jgi:uncharacterized protein
MPRRHDSPTLASCLYEGVVHHRRMEPFEHAFRYRLFCVYLDLDELDRVFSSRWFWSTSRPALAWFRRQDHFGDPAEPLAESVRRLVEEQTGRRPAGPIRVLTHLRYFGYVINPISMYYCFDEAGAAVEACVAEVTNTPWGDRHCYVLPDPVAAPDQRPAPVCEKQLHVSPFMPMEMQYRWQVSVPGEALSLSIENHTREGRAFRASMSLARRPLSGGQLASVLLRYPFMTARVAAGIYWQAARLWWKGAPFYPHPRLRSARPEGTEPAPLIRTH